MTITRRIECCIWGGACASSIILSNFLHNRYTRKYIVTQLFPIASFTVHKGKRWLFDLTFQSRKLCGDHLYLNRSVCITGSNGKTIIIILWHQPFVASTPVEASGDGSPKALELLHLPLVNLRSSYYAAKHFNYSNL